MEDLFSSGIRPLIDISETVNKHQDALHWDLLIQRARGWQVQKAVFLTLALSKELLDLQLPKQVLADLMPEGTNQLVISSARDKITSQAHISSNFARIWGQGGLQQRSSSLFNRLFPPAGEMSRKYSLEPGRSHLYLAYLRRLKDLATRYGSMSIRMLAGDKSTRSITNPDIVLTRWLESG